MLLGYAGILRGMHMGDPHPRNGKMQGQSSRLSADAVQKMLVPWDDATSGVGTGEERERSSVCPRDLRKLLSLQTLKWKGSLFLWSPQQRVTLV